MNKRTLDDVMDVATVTKAPMTRAEKLSRWADILDQNDRPLCPYFGMEHMTHSALRSLRSHYGTLDTPLTLALADPVLKAEGIKGETMGEVGKFFELSDQDAHALLCDCNYLGRMTGPAVAENIRYLRDRTPRDVTALPAIRSRDRAYYVTINEAPTYEYDVLTRSRTPHSVGYGRDGNPPDVYRPGEPAAPEFVVAENRRAWRY